MTDESSRQTVNARIRDALRAAGVHCTAAELSDMIDEDAAGIATRLSQLYRSGELDRRLGDGGKFEYGIASAGQGTRAPARKKPRRGPPRPVTARQTPAPPAAPPPASAPAPAPTSPPAPPAARHTSPPVKMPAPAPAAAAPDKARTLPDVVRDFVAGDPRPQTLQQRGAVVLGHMHQLAEHAASEAPPSAVVQILRAARKLRAALEAS